jgi:hypothetical protein
MTSSDLSGRSVVAGRDHGAGQGRAAQLARHVGLTSGMGVNRRRVVREPVEPGALAADAVAVLVILSVAEALWNVLV